ncbi:hypothetical protein ABT56_18330 [Photobacterium aquae]|uniref:KfrA N-terminal DNA-binding domain-containing protein n=2 Tax=Photobacterium aquae TaxID=1195763 RepID=A0A0J1GVG9_9GAMM|nr:hypothetical protein ABT56_18330 [Photobacterium aquae]
MVAAKVTVENVFAVANRIVDQGEKPTVLKVHKALGVGSYSTIQKHLKAWEESDAGLEAMKAALPDEIVLPNNAQDAMADAMKIIWAAAQKAAQAIIEKHQLAIQAENEEQEAMIRDVLGKVETTELRLKDAEARVRQLESERDASIDERATLRQQLDASQLELSREQSAHQEMRNQHASEMKIANAQVDELKQALAKSNDALSNSQHELIAELSRHDESKQQLASVSAELKASERLLGNLESQIAELKVGSREYRDSVTETRNALTDARVSESALGAELKDARNVIDELKVQLAESQKMFTDLKADNIDLRKALDGEIATYLKGLTA